MLNQSPEHCQKRLNLICMNFLMFPAKKSQLGMFRKYVQGWTYLKPSQCTISITLQMIFPFAWRMLSTSSVNLEAATVLLISYAAYLQAFEAFSLSWNDVAFPFDIQLTAFGPKTAGVNIRNSKTSRTAGRLQLVPVTDQKVIMFLRTYQLQNQGCHLFAIHVSYKTYLSALQSISSSFGFSSGGFSTLSARSGKTTEDYINNMLVHPVDIKGHWKSLNSLR